MVKLFITVNGMKCWTNTTNATVDNFFSFYYCIETAYKNKYFYFTANDYVDCCYNKNDYYRILKLKVLL